MIRPAASAFETTTVWRYSVIIILFSAQGISDTEGEETKNNVDAGMTVSAGGLPTQNCRGAR